MAFAGSERLIGDAAKNQVVQNLENTVFGAKRLIGRKFQDEEVQADTKHFSFKVIAGLGDKPTIKVTAQGKEKMFYPEGTDPLLLVL